MQKEHLFKYLLRLGDNSLIHGHRLTELCSKGPILEEDIALSNIALDLIGQARMFYQYAATIEGKSRTEDDLAYKRKEHEFYSCLLMEQPNGDFAKTILKLFFTSIFNEQLYTELLKSEDTEIAAIAAKSLKEVKYHVRHTQQWVLRLGDGTEESHTRISNALDELWMFTGELFQSDEIEETLLESGIGADLSKIQSAWKERVNAVLIEATLTVPENDWAQTGGKNGYHSEHLGFLLAEMQYLPNAYPDAIW